MSNVYCVYGALNKVQIERVQMEADDEVKSQKESLWMSGLVFDAKVSFDEKMV